MRWSWSAPSTASRAIARCSSSTWRASVRSRVPTRSPSRVPRCGSASWGGCAVPSWPSQAPRPAPRVPFSHAGRRGRAGRCGGWTRRILHGAAAARGPVAGRSGSGDGGGGGRPQRPRRPQRHGCGQRRDDAADTRATCRAGRGAPGAGAAGPPQRQARTGHPHHPAGRPEHARREGAPCAGARFHLPRMVVGRGASHEERRRVHGGRRRLRVGAAAGRRGRHEQARRERRIRDGFVSNPGRRSCCTPTFTWWTGEGSRGRALTRRAIARRPVRQAQGRLSPRGRGGTLTHTLARIALSQGARGARHGHPQGMPLHQTSGSQLLLE